MEAALRLALEREEFLVHYQPKIHLVTGEIEGVEALIRWNHPEEGMISPEKFIPFAEQTGMILPIGEWVLRTACKQSKNWQEAGLPPMIMAVNLSASQFYQPNLVDMIEQVLEETELSPEFLELEITESMVMDVHKVFPILNDLKRIGVKISMDDFGTGYSSLYYLKEFPIDRIKIDQSFVRSCTTDRKDATIVKAIIAMAHQLEIEVIAEGVESRDHLIFLQQNLCNKAQGFFFSKALPPDELVQKFDGIEGITPHNGIPQHINRQKWLEESLEKAQQELRDTVRQQQGLILKFIKHDGTFIYTVSDGELLYRMGLTPEQLLGKSLHDFLPKALADRYYDYYQRAWEGEEHVTYEGELNGVWYTASLRPIRRGGQVVEVISSCVDITQRKFAEEALQKSERQYRQLVELSPEPMVVHQNGTIQFANPAFIELLKASSLEELVGKYVRDFSPPDYRNLVEERIRRLDREGILVTPTEEKLICLDGTLIDVEVTGISFNYEGTPSYLMITHDLTARKQAEEAIRQSEEKYRLIADNMHDLIGIMDTEGIVQYASPSHETILGFPPAVYEGSSGFEFAHPDDIPQIQQQYLNISSTKTSCPVEFRFKHANGGWVFVEGVATPVLDEENEIKHVLVVARDISERKKAEEMLLKSEKLSVVGQLAAGVAHEIRNPLTAIKGFVQLFNKQMDQAQPLYIDTILSEISNLEAIVDGFLAFAKPHSPKKEKLDIKIVLQQVIRLFESQAHLNNIEIVQELAPDLPMICCDGNQMKRVFINILQNAVEAMPNGGKITIQLSRQTQDFIQLKFIDQGTGIPDERIKKIGEPFFNTKEKGTGLGLMMTQKMVQEQGGTIDFESKLDDGTVAKVTLSI
ncbi:EAL domain-containing protein [Pullulanibacillus sp. KACC 23026]|uniref:EAL domain-containing protein n=1 Tax=Pullulanibacillus sp. KACC 23026 TaxID=3028315 RepID=UPI0023AFC891|nr:EAL domain-containing protein [Pullulanibacillus sp. KACC 23026]WEG13473.1 EAL domain-containing protein [Pullulanibacillus sp. KACC 23026]